MKAKILNLSMEPVNDNGGIAAWLRRLFYGWGQVNDNAAFGEGKDGQ